MDKSYDKSYDKMYDKSYGSVRSIQSGSTEGILEDDPEILRIESKISLYKQSIMYYDGKAAQYDPSDVNERKLLDFCESNVKELKEGLDSLIRKKFEYYKGKDNRHR